MISAIDETNGARLSITEPVRRIHTLDEAVSPRYTARWRQWCFRTPGRRRELPDASDRAVAADVDTYILQYPQRADRRHHPPQTARSARARLVRGRRWSRAAPLRLFGHCMGAVVAFEFARIAESRDTAVQRLWVSAGPAPSPLPHAGVAHQRRRAACRHRRPRRHRSRSACRP